MKSLLKSKTFYTGIAAIVAGIILAFLGCWETGVELIVGGLVAIFLRHNMPKHQRG